MSKRMLFILASLFALLVSTTLWRQKQERRVAPGAADLAADLATLPWQDLTTIEISQSTNTLRLIRDQSVWGIAQRYGYPADSDRLVRAVRQIVLLEGGTRIPEGEFWLDEYDLDSQALTAGRAIELRFLGADEQAFLILRLGAGRPNASLPEAPETTFGGGGRYLLVHNNVWLFPQTFSDWQVAPDAWLDKDLFSVQAMEIARLALSTQNAQTILVFTREPGKPWSTDALPPEHELDQAALDSLAGALSYVRIQDLAEPGLDNTAMDFESSRQTVFTTTNGWTYTIELGATNDENSDRHARFTVSYSPPQQPPMESAESSPEFAPSSEDAAKYLADLNHRIAGRTFILTAWQAERLAPAHDTLFKTLSAIQPEDPSEPIALDGPPLY